MVAVSAIASSCSPAFSPTSSPQPQAASPALQSLPHAMPEPSASSVRLIASKPALFTPAVPAPQAALQTRNPSMLEKLKAVRLWFREVGQHHPDLVTLAVSIGSVVSAGAALSAQASGQALKQSLSELNETFARYASKLDRIRSLERQITGGLTRVAELTTEATKLQRDFDFSNPAEFLRRYHDEIEAMLRHEGPSIARFNNAQGGPPAWRYFLKRTQEIALEKEALETTIASARAVRGTLSLSSEIATLRTALQGSKSHINKLFKTAEAGVMGPLSEEVAASAATMAKQLKYIKHLKIASAAFAGIGTVLVGLELAESYKRTHSFTTAMVDASPMPLLLGLMDSAVPTLDPNFDNVSYLMGLPDGAAAKEMLNPAGTELVDRLYAILPKSKES